MLTNAMGKTKVLFVSLAFQAATSFGAASQVKTIKVAGWPLNVSTLPEALLSRDPLLGNLVCPALSRLNLLELRSEPYLLQKIEQRDDRWILTPRLGLKWWDGNNVTLSEMEEFLKAELPSAVQREGFGRWKLPAMSFVQESGKLVIQWKSSPDFGPYVLNQIPFSKVNDTNRWQVPFQCVGSLQPDFERERLYFKPHEDTAKLAWLSDVNVEIKSSEGPYVAFRFGEDLHPSGHKRQLDEALVCSQPLDTPHITLIAWNPNSIWAKEPKFRKSMTHLLPRGALLRSGAGSLGDLVSGPLLRSHPGYNTNLKVPSYDPLLADKLLNSLGYRRSEDGYRRTAEGQLIELKILVSDFEGSTLLRKVLDDSFRALGLKTIFTQNPGEKVDAKLTSIASSWPDANPSRFLHSQASKTPWPWRYSDQPLDQALDHYAVSLTHEKPDFRLLEKVHELVYKLEPFSILMQHRACVDIQLGKSAKAPQKVSLRNPDWFSDLTGLTRLR